MSIAAHIVYGLAWLSFGAVHSLLARQTAKDLLRPLLGRAYRLIYNVFALAHIGIVIYGGRYVLGDAPKAFDLPATVQQMLLGLTLLGAIIFAVALFQYDLGRFAGLTQLMQAGDDDTAEPLELGGLHRFVRHPLYSGAHLYLWGSIRTEFDLATALWASAYLVIGSRFEERSLIASYGGAYRDYMKRVPSVIPWRGRAI